MPSRSHRVGRSAPRTYVRGAHRPTRCDLLGTWPRTVPSTANAKLLRTTWACPVGDVTHTHTHVACQLTVMFSDISDDELLSASELVQNFCYVEQNDLWTGDLSNEQLLIASQAYDVEHADLWTGDVSNEDSVIASQAYDGSSKRCGEPLTDDQLAVLQQGRFPRKTVDNATWAVTLFGEWRGQRNRRCIEENDGNDLVYLNKPFELMSDEELNYCLPFFLAEIKKRDGQPFPAATLRQIVLSLQKFLEVQGRQVKLLGDMQFRAVRDTLDALMKQRIKAGVGMNHRQAQIITEEMENTLWEKGLLGDDCPSTLLNTMVYLFGLHFALRGREEHRQLRHNPSQISIKVGDSGRRYLEYKQVCVCCCHLKVFVKMSTSICLAMFANVVAIKSNSTQLNFITDNCSPKAALK